MSGIGQLIADFVVQIYETFGWPGVVGVMILESTNLPIPSEVTMPLAGWILVQDHGRSQAYALVAGGFYGALGTTIGSVLLYFVGAHGGPPFLRKYGRYLFISKQDIEKANRWFERWGEAAVFLGRLIPFIRTLVSLPAGLARMSLWRFVVFTFFGTFVWSAALTWAGYQLGSNWSRLEGVMQYLYILTIAVIVALLIWFIKNAVGRDRSQSESISG